MFSAIFGNIFYSRVEEQAEGTDVTSNKFTEASTQTSDNKSASTQVNLDESKYNESKLNDTLNSQSGLDWVIVDAENDKACGVNNSENLVEMKNSEPESQDTLIGSFFQKHETDEAKPIDVDQADNQIQPVLPKKNDTWLITPLPCLTSITESSQQKSMIDNDPLENLLIEQPNRFMSASTTAVSETNNNTSKNTPKRRSKKQRKTETKQSEDIMQSDDACFIEDLFKEVEPATPVITKRTVGEKRKEAERSSPASPTPSNESPKKISRKSGKNLKNKGATLTQKNFNKENMQVKSLLLAECLPKTDTKQKNTHARYGQMLRANKNSALFSMAGNARQRKFHNLQQPMVTMPKKNQKF